ncbi:MAG: hypothetical protein Q8R83_00555 [Legionellaceae bacterium]|nr:hypothetical protein [Legionellaceae bacterium]
MKQKTINTIIELAITAYHKRATPSEFAKAAAHKATFEAAAAHHAELADFATLTAVAVFYIEITDAVHFSARVTDRAADKLEAEKNYRAEWQEYSSTTIPKHVVNNYFSTIAESSDRISQAFKEAIAPTYESTSVLSVVARNKAKRAALYSYRDTYATTRSAYIRALFIANQNKSDQHQFEAFKKEISNRLMKDLAYDRIDPGIFLKTMASISLRLLLLLILLAAIGAILLASFHVTPIPFIPLICAGSGSSAFTLTTGFGSFFARKRCTQIEEENANRAEVAIVA